MAYTTIDKPTDYFNTKLYTGNGGTQSITGVGFQPDWTWIKNRTDGSTSHYLTDSVRGAGKSLRSNSSNNEATETNQLTAFDSDGFSIGNWGDGNGSGKNIVAWNWLASNTTASNTDGSITSSVSANTTAGFSIVSYTGSGSTGTIGHGLNSVPQVVICKKRSGSSYDESWYVYHVKKGNTHALGLNGTGAGEDNTFWNDTTPTSSVFSVGTDNVNRSGNLFIAYCFAEKKGYSKFGSYTGNGNANGTFVYLGFKPAWLMIKASSQTADWVMFDNKRNPFNLVEKYLDANTSDAEGDDSGGSGSWELDFVSNGFKLRENSGGLNQNGTTFIYMAFAESPFVTGASAIPTTAR